MHLDQLARLAEAGANEAGGKAIIFDTITISDGISMGTEGMKYSLVSREVIADSIETVVGCMGMDGFVAVGGCDKNMPGALIAIARLNRPAVFVYGGTILPGCLNGDKRKLDIVSVFEAIPARANHKISESEFQAIEACAIPGPGSCAGIYTGNTIASAVEALGMSLPNSSAQNAIAEAKKKDCRSAGAAVVNILRQGIRPLDIVSKKVFDNAIIEDFFQGRFFGIKYPRPASKAESFLACDFGHSSLGREISIKDHQMAILFDRITQWMNDRLAWWITSHFAQRFGHCFTGNR